MKLCMYRVSVLLLVAIFAIPALSSSSAFASTDLFIAVGGKGTNCTSSKPCGSIQHTVNIAIVQGNSVHHNGGYGVHLCGPSSSPLCVPPGSSATASTNVVRGNRLDNNALGEFADFGTNNRVNQ